MIKILEDTLKGPNGKFSRKSLTAFFSFIMACLVGVFIVISDWFLPELKTINQYAIMVFWGFLSLAGGAITLSVVDKMKKYGGGGSDE